MSRLHSRIGKVSPAWPMVSPWEMAPGISSTNAVAPPSGAGINAAVNFIRECCRRTWQASTCQGEKPCAGEGGEVHGASAKTGTKPACLKVVRERLDERLVLHHHERNAVCKRPLFVRSVRVQCQAALI